MKITPLSMIFLTTKMSLSEENEGHFVATFLRFNTKSLQIEAMFSLFDAIFLQNEENVHRFEALFPPIEAIQAFVSNLFCGFFKPYSQKQTLVAHHVPTISDLINKVKHQCGCCGY